MATHQNAPTIPADELVQMYREYRSELRVFFKRQAYESHSADDLVQMVYVELLKARPTTIIRNPKAYLFRLAWCVLHRANQNARKEYLRRQRWIGDETWDGLARQFGSLLVADDTGSAFALDECMRAIERLPPVSQYALLLQYRDGRSYGEIAGELGVSRDTVKKYISRAVNEIRMALNSSESDR